MEKVSWMDHITNDEVLERVDEEKLLIKTIRKRQKEWTGHILRGESLLKEIIEGRTHGKRSRGRQRTMMLDWMIKEESYEKIKRSANHRSEWR